MSAFAGAIPRLRAKRWALSADLVAVLSLGALFVALTYLTWGAWGDLGKDTGYDLVAASRVAHGQLPYADFVYYYGPLAPAVLGLAAFVGGGGILPAVFVGLAITGAILALTYTLARGVTSPLAAALATAIAAGAAFAPTNFSFVLPHTESATLGVLCLLLFLLAVRQAAERSGIRNHLLAGVAGGFVALTRPEAELAFLAAALAWIVLGPRMSRRALLALAGPALLIPAAVYGAFLAAVSPHALVFENLYPVDTLRAAGDAVLRLHAPLTAASFARLGLMVAIYAVGVALLVGLAELLRRRPALREPAVVLGVAAAVVAAVRPETTRFYLGWAYGWIPAGAAIAVVLVVRRGRRDGFAPKTQAALAEAVVLAVLAAPVYASFSLAANHVQPAVYLAPFVALLLVRLHLVEVARSQYGRTAALCWLAFLGAAGIGLAVHDAAHETSVRGPGGSLSAPSADAAVYAQAVKWVDSQTRPGDAVLFAPQLTALYVLARRSDPLPQISLLPGALPREADELAAVARLRAADVRVIVTDRHIFSEYGHTDFGGTFDRTLGAFIFTTFDHIATLGGGPGARTLDLWRRHQ